MKCWRLFRLVDCVSGELMVAWRNAGLGFGIMNEGASQQTNDKLGYRRVV